MHVTLFLLEVEELTKSGLPVSGDAEYLASEPKIQELQSAVFWAQRQSAAATDASTGSATRAVHDRLDRVTPSCNSLWSVSF